MFDHRGERKGSKVQINIFEQCGEFPLHGGDRELWIQVIHEQGQNGNAESNVGFSTILQTTEKLNPGCTNGYSRDLYWHYPAGSLADELDDPTPEEELEEWYVLAPESACGSTISSATYVQTESAA